MNTDDKRNYIYENIYKLNDHKNLLKIVKSSRDANMQKIKMVYF